MSRKIFKKQYSKKILNTLAKKPAMPLENLVIGLQSVSPIVKSDNYALTRCIKNLNESGCIEIIQSDNKKSYLKLTIKGEKKLNRIKLEGEGALVPTVWDGLWRIIILDIPEERKNERESLRYLLKKANFTCVKNTIWISPFPYEHLFANIKKDLGLGTELIIIIADKLDDETNSFFLKSIKK